MWIEVLDRKAANTDHFSKLTFYYKDFLDQDKKETKSAWVLAGVANGTYIEISKFETDKEAKQAMLELMQMLNAEKVDRNVKREPYSPVPCNPYPYPYPYVAPNTSPINPYTSPYCEPTITTPKVDWQPTWAKTTTNDLNK